MKNQIITNPQDLVPVLNLENLDYAFLIANRNAIEWTPENQQIVLFSEPNRKWLKPHPLAKTKDDQGRTVPVMYLPIDKVEFLLRLIFGRYKIEVLSEGQLFNSVYCKVRVHYFNPVYKEWEFQDGVGAVDIQTEQGSSPADLSKIKSMATMKALPSAKSYAIKDACDHIGRIFGGDLNRKDTIALSMIIKAEEKQEIDKSKIAMNNLNDVLANRKK